MSALHYSEQGLSTPIVNPLSDVKSLSKLFYSINSHQWPAFECSVTIRNWIKEAPDLLEKEVRSSVAKGGGWVLRKDSILDQIVKEALDENAPANSLWRFIYMQKKDLKPVITFGLIYIHGKDQLKATRKRATTKPAGEHTDAKDSKDDEKSKSKSKLNPEQEAKGWLAVAKQFLVEILTGVELPSKIVDGIPWIMQKNKRKKRDDNEEQELPISKHPRTESPKHSDATLQTSQLPDPCIQGNPQLPAQLRSQQPQLQPQRPQPVLIPVQDWQKDSGHEIFTVTALELIRALMSRMDNWSWGAEKLGPSAESPVRVDLFPRKKGMFSIFLGQTAKNLAKLAVPPATSKDRAFSISSSHLFEYVLGLAEQGDKFDLQYCQGIAIVCLPPDYFLILLGQTFIDIKEIIQKGRNI